MPDSPTPTQQELAVSTLGPCEIPTPLAEAKGGHGRFIEDDTRVMYDVVFHEGHDPKPAIGFERAGPREKIHFQPAKSKAAIVTCGGLCPGLNNVVRNLFYMHRRHYGTAEVLGIRNGYQGLNPAEGQEPITLTDSLVSSIHHQGGTLLGTSRGPQDPRVTVDFLQSQGVNILHTIGGDGTQRGAHAIAQEVARRGADIAVVGVPKTIDNDIRHCYQTFGFMSAVAEAERVIDRAHVEAISVPRGVGLVKLMGRHAGFLAASATIASGEVNFTIIPEAPLVLDGQDGLLARLGRRLDASDHAVVVVAEGAGQELLRAEKGDHAPRVDASGNELLSDIGLYLRKRIKQHFADIGNPVELKYIDPSYYVRSVHANAYDSLMTEKFARHAVHAAMAGKTDLFIGIWQGHMVHVPLSASCGQERRLSTGRDMWSAVLTITGQERW
ncbi:6-phosphofructokinase 1 [Pseudobythopirellula maris]|uniref:6-phosphofructokinase 1 n=1 Tax=Pseudobythopirellula maris TaxID=2527991 RepID=A0A5C5ZM45_9BACT|nr:ATP-dependent 6-phosphofructokinase [Pseudobythopirellula maris]TWT88469.1 6-phosphofructokinase 1 [Pseudobythopirellula maris]